MSKKLIDNINKYYNTVMGEIKKIPVGEKDALRGISYTTEQKQQSKLDKQSFLGYKQFRGSPQDGQRIKLFSGHLGE